MKVCSRCKLNKDDSAFGIRVEKRSPIPFQYLNNVCKECAAKISNKNYWKHKDDPKWIYKWRKNSLDHHKKNRASKLALMKKRRESPEGRKYRTEYDKSHKNKIKAQHSIVAKKWHEFQRDNITDVYCIGLIRSQNGGKKKCIVTHEMIEQKREQIKLKRKLYEIKRKIEPRGSHGRVNSVFSGANFHGSNP